MENTRKRLQQCILNMEKIAMKDTVSQTDVVYLIAYSSKILYEYDKLEAKLKCKQQSQ